MKRRLNRMKDEEGRIVEGEDEVLEVLVRHWEEHGRRSEDDVVPDAAMGDVGGCEFGMFKEVSWEEVVEVLKRLRRWNAPSPDGILYEMVMDGDEK